MDFVVFEPESRYFNVGAQSGLQSPKLLDEVFGPEKRALDV